MCFRTVILSVDPDIGCGLRGKLCSVVPQDRFKHRILGVQDKEASQGCRGGEKQTELGEGTGRRNWTHTGRADVCLGLAWHCLGHTNYQTKHWTSSERLGSLGKQGPGAGALLPALGPAAPVEPPLPDMG